MYKILSNNICPAREFVDFWFRFYEYPSEKLYSDSIFKTNFVSNDLRNLFTWKNGMRLSNLKNSSLERKILHNLDKVNKLKSIFSIEDYHNSFKELSTIWKIFLLHCIQPNSYPIFDQHVYRAMNFIKHNTINEVAKSEKQKYNQYENYYLPFFNSIVDESGCGLTKVDRALWVFGKSIKSGIIKNIIHL